MATSLRSADGVGLSVSEGGEGRAVVLLHGLTATRRYVVMGSRLLEREGHRVIAYDARGHGSSDPASTPRDYGYGDLVGDLEAVLDGLGVERAVLAGASMGAHTALAFALAHPERVSGVVVITPGYDPGLELAPERLARWDALSRGLREGGIDGFLAASELPADAPELAATIERVIRQRLARHEHLEAVADALSAVPRSTPFPDLGVLGEIRLPAAVVASGDRADPEHPEELGRRYAAAIPGARLVLDRPGHSPTAWQGSQVSRIIAEVAAAS